MRQGKCIGGTSDGRRLEIGCTENLVKLDLYQREFSVMSRFPRVGSRGDPGSNGEDRARGLAKDLFRHRAHDQLTQPGAAMRAQNHQIDLLLLDDLREYIAHLAVPQV